MGQDLGIPGNRNEQFPVSGSDKGGIAAPESVRETRSRASSLWARVAAFKKSDSGARTTACETYPQAIERKVLRRLVL